MRDLLLERTDALQKDQWDPSPHNDQNIVFGVSLKSENKKKNSETA